MTTRSFYDGLSMVSAAMVISGGEGKEDRVMRFDEFNEFVSKSKKLAMLNPIPRLMEDFNYCW